MWIADEALNSPLPLEWTEHHDSSDRVFYYNVQTHASSWTHPLEQLHRDTYKRIVDFRSGSFSKEDQAAELEKMRHECDDMEREAHDQLQMWTEHCDEQGQKFYYNKEEQRSVWTDPRPARCHALYLHMKALRVLSKLCGQPAAPIPCERQRPVGLLGNLNAEGNGGSDYERSPKQNINRIQPAQLLSPVGAEGAPPAGKGQEHRRRKKRRDGEASQPDLFPQATSKDTDDFSNGDIKRVSALDMKRPTTSDVREVRAALGVGISSSQSLRALPELARLPTPPGDGLTHVGRTKVRAGIRLEPIR
jgi:hypothetical protein